MGKVGLEGEFYGVYCVYVLFGYDDFGYVWFFIFIFGVVFVVVDEYD